MENVIEFRTSHIDLWRKYIQNEIDIDDVASSLKSNYGSNIRMNLGTLFHSYLEDKNKNIELFNPTCIEYARQLFQGGIFETKYKKNFLTKYGNVLISGTADNIYGNRINEFKTTWGKFSVERYLNSMQWQMYLQIFSAVSMTYHVFEFPYLKTGWNEFCDIDELLEYKELHQFTVYESMVNHDLVSACIEGITQFCLERNIKPILTNSI